MVGEITTEAGGNGKKIFAQNTLENISNLGGVVFSSPLKFSGTSNFARKVTVVVYCTTATPIFTFRITSPDRDDVSTITFESVITLDAIGRSTGEFFVREQDEFNVQWVNAVGDEEVLCLILT